MVRRFWKQRIRWLRAYVHYLRNPFLAFLPLFSALLALLLIGGYCFQHYYHEEPLSYVRALYITYCLIFMEHLVKFPQHWLLQLFYFVLPPLGLVVILDGFVRFGYRVLRRTDQEPEWVRAMAKTFNHHVVLCGLGRVGLRVLQQLLQLGEDVVILEKNPDNHNIAFARKKNVPVLIGNGREELTLHDLNVAEAKSIILATDDDLANLEMALDARKVNSDIQVVLRMFDQELASKIREAFDIQLALSTSALAAPLFATSSSDRSIENSFYVADQLLVVANLTINPDSDMVGKTIRDVSDELPVFFLSHASDAMTTHFPSAETIFQSGDRVTIQTEPETLSLLHRRNRDAMIS